jgi:DNA-binding beta-propeller fold protein YncE
VINSSTNNIDSHIDVRGQPLAIAFNPSTNDMYVTSYGSNQFGTKGSVSIINSSTNNIDYTITIYPQTHMLGDIAFNPSNKHMYVANTGSDAVSVIDASTHIQRQK